MEKTSIELSIQKVIEGLREEEKTKREELDAIVDEVKKHERALTALTGTSHKRKKRAKAAAVAK